MPHYKLTYLACRALGEPLRLLFVLAGVPFEDKRIPLKDYQEVKHYGFGQVPVLEVDGQPLTQSVAIARYLGSTFGFLPSDAFLAARCDEVVDIVTELRLEFRPLLTERDESRLPELRQRLVAQHFPKYYGILEGLVGGEFIAGSGAGSLSWADVVLANWLEIWGESGLLTPVFLKAFPALCRLQEAVFGVPAIAAYVSSRPSTPF